MAIKTLKNLLLILMVLCIGYLLVFVSPAHSTNPITSVTNNGTILTPSGTGYEINWTQNAHLIKDGDTYWVTYFAVPLASFPSCSDTTWSQTLFASLPVSSFPGTVSKLGDSYNIPHPPTSGYHGVGDTGISYDPVTGIYHSFTNTITCGCAYGICDYIGHLTNTVMGGSGWTYASAAEYDKINPTLYSHLTSGWAWGGTPPVPKAGGGWIIYLTTGFAAMNIFYMTADDLSGTWTAGAKLAGVEAVCKPELFIYFVHNSVYYIIGNCNPAGPVSERLWSSTDQINWTYEADVTSTFGTVGYITGLGGLSLNGGGLYGLSNLHKAANDTGIVAFTLNATPVSNPEPVLSGVSGSLVGGTLTVTGTATPGVGGALWEVGLYNSATGARSRATWGSWGASSPGTVANTFSGTIAASESDYVTVTAYNVALEKDEETVQGTPGADGTTPSVVISTSSPQSISSDSLTVTGTASDAVGVSGCKFRIGSEPDATHGTVCSGTTSWSCSTSGYTSGAANTLYVECYDAVPNYSTGHSITINYNIAAIKSVGSGIKLSGGTLQ